MHLFPTEVWIKIIISLDIKTILSLRATSKYFYNMLKCKNKKDFNNLFIVLVKMPPIHKNLVNLIQLSSDNYENLSYLQRFIFIFNTKKQLSNIKINELLALEFFLRNKAKVACYWDRDWSDYCYKIFINLSPEKKHLLFLEMKLAQLYNTGPLSRTSEFGLLGKYWFPLLCAD